MQWLGVLCTYSECMDIIINICQIAQVWRDPMKYTKLDVSYK